VLGSPPGIFIFRQGLAVDCPRSPVEYAHNYLVILRFSRDLFEKSVPSLTWPLRHAQSVAKNKNRWSPLFEERSQSSSDQYVSRVAFVAMAPYAPIEEPGRALKYHVTEATWIEI
jgi:hypothetical protein